MTPQRFRRLCDILDRRQPDLTVLMDNVHKPHNVSAVIRTCDAIGISTVHAVSPHRDFRARHCSASGAGRYVSVDLHDSHEHAFAALRRQGLRVVAAHWTETAVDFRAFDFTTPTALLLGSELDGLDPNVVQHADAFAVIPMMGAVKSLNVSVAAAVILYEAQRQRAEAGLYDRSHLDADTRASTLFEWAYPRIADLCRRKGTPYTRLDANGEILDPIPRG